MDLENNKSLMDFMLNFDKLFDVIRIVDPISKRVIEYKEVDESCRDSVCYDYWKNGIICPNCVSSRAINENNTFVKIEYNKDKIYMILASPVNFSKQKLVVEMLKDISKTGIVPDLKGKTIEEINDIIEQLNREVIIDDLTQCFNRRYLNERLPVDIYNSISNNTNLSVIMLDCDSFKLINDTYGHTAGDTVLKEIGTIIKSIIRDQIDWVARYGGDEFLIALINTNSCDANKVAERLKKEIANRIIKHEGKSLSVSVSTGLYTIVSDKNSVPINTNDLLNLVDKSLYASKQKNSR